MMVFHCFFLLFSILERSKMIAATLFDQDAPRPSQDAPKAPKTTPRRRFWDDFKKILEDLWKSFGRIVWKILPSNLPPLLEDFLFASLFCVRLIVQRSPAVLPLCGLNTAGEPASLQPCQPFGYLAKLATLLQKGSLEGGSA